MSLDDSLRPVISSTCYAIVSGRFADMINKENQGPKFNWKDFPDIMAERCASELFLYLDMSDLSDHEKGTLEYAAKSFGREIATNLVSRAGLGTDFQ